MKGDVIILNPFLPPIMSSKIAFSYGLGRVAKLSKIEATLNQFLEGLCNVPSKIASGELLNMDMSDVQKTAGQLLLFQQSLLINAEDGFLDTPDLHWTKPELEGTINK